MSPVLQASGLVKHFDGVAAVDGVSLAVAAGEVVALIGPNGAGKSTLFNMLMGQLRPDAGDIRITGQRVNGWPTRRIWRLGVGRTFQVARPFASFSVLENVQLAILSREHRLLQLFHRASPLMREEAMNLLQQVGMAEQGDRPCALLAYGDVKRLDLALALAVRPRLLLMDEPTAGMAPGERQALLRLATGLARSERLAILFTEHDMDAVFEHAERVLVLSRGRLLAEGKPQAVRANSEVQAVYLGLPETAA
jgi:branched-chain amino acid transport system ATP-binding protein